MSAKDAVLTKTGSHWVDEGQYDSRVDGIGREEVYLYFTAKWRGQDVIVTMSADRYVARVSRDSRSNESWNELVPWRIVCRDAKYHDPEKSGGRGEDCTGTARSALSKLCEPLVTEWLASDAYEASFKRSLGQMVMRKFEDQYLWSNNVCDALHIFADRLPHDVFVQINKVLDARRAYEDAKQAAFTAINGEES